MSAVLDGVQRHAQSILGNALAFRRSARRMLPSRPAPATTGFAR